MSAAARELRPTEIVGMYESHKEALEVTGAAVSCCNCPLQPHWCVYQAEMGSWWLQHLLQRHSTQQACILLLCHSQ